MVMGLLPDVVVVVVDVVLVARLVDVVLVGRLEVGVGVLGLVMEA